MSNKKGLLAQVAGLFLFGVLVTGIFTHIMMRLDAEQTEKKQIENHAKSIAQEVNRAVLEYPAFEWLLSFWYNHSNELEIEYDVGFNPGTETEKKCKLFAEQHPDIQLKYATDKDITALPEEDQRLYAEITYSWLITRINQIKQTYQINFLFCVVTDEKCESQFFIFSAADPGAVRGTNYEEVYPLGKTVSVDKNQQEAMQAAVRNFSHLAEAGDYVDYYCFLANADNQNYLIGLTYSRTELMNDISVQTMRATLYSAILQVLLSAICMFMLILLVLNPLKKVQMSIRRFRVNKDFDAISNQLSSVKTRNEIGQLAKDVTDLSVEINNYMGEIRTITAETERIGTELSIASKIQEASIPTVFPAFPGRGEFDIFASMTPAKEVGGDFYDFFLVDDNHLALVIADVSGKGVPAALFMMVTKILINERTMSGDTPGKILSVVNDRICAHNDADMFVTVWLGICEISTGKILAANAGHENPVIYRAGGNFEILKNKHGLVIGAMSGISYHDYEIQLNAGDKLFLYTDGVPEATDSNNRMFGMDRMLNALNDGKLFSPEKILNAVWAHVKEFVGDAPQFDDLTMLCFEMRELVSKTDTLITPASAENLDRVSDFIDRFLEQHNCSEKTKMRIDLSVEEIFVNIANYAYPDTTGEVEIRISEKDNMISISFIDSGVPYDPLQKIDPDITLSANQRQIGGLGIFLVKKNMDHVCYRFENGKNILTISKNIQKI